jgi:hypothetical protein
LPPEIARGLNLLTTEAQALTDAPLVPALSPFTQQGIEALAQPIGGQSQQFLQSLLSPQAINLSPEARGFFGAQIGADPLAPESRTFLTDLLAADPAAATRPDISGVTDLVTRDVARAIGNQFTASGRLPAGAAPPMGLFQTVADRVTQQVAPLAFQAEENALARALQAQGQQIQGAQLFANLAAQDEARRADAATRLAELDRLQAQFGLSQQQLGFNAAQALPLFEDLNTQRLLQAGQLEQAQAQAELLEPFERLRLIGGPITGAAQVAPTTTTQTREFRTSPFAQIVGGLLGGLNTAARIGQAGGGGGLGGLFGGGGGATVPSFTPFSVPSLPSGLSLGTPGPSSGLLFG